MHKHTFVARTVSRETMKAWTKRLFERQIESWGVSLDAVREDALFEYVRLLSGYGEANIIGTRDPEEIVLKHVLDSLSCLIFKPLSHANNLIDVGSGAGFPGIPLKLTRPDLEVSLVEATGKKVKFLHKALEDLQLEKTEPLHIRAEICGRLPDYRARYDVATTRALAALPVVAEYCVPLVREGGYAIAMKGAPTADEITGGARAAKKLGARISGVVEIPLLPELQIENRRLVIIEKISETPAKYPRQVGVPGKRPLGGAS